MAVGLFVRPDQLIFLALELDEVGRGEDVLPGLVELHAVVAHHQLVGLEVGLGQRDADLLRIGRAGAIDRIGEREEALHVARAGVVEIAAGLGLVHLVDLGGDRARLADVPGAAVHRALRDVGDRRDERRIGEAGIVADHHRRQVVEVLHRLHVEDRIRRVADEDHDVGLLLLELQHLRRDVGRARAIGNADRDRDVGFLRLLDDRVGDRGAVIGVFVDDRDRADRLALLLHVVEEAHIGARHSRTRSA